MSGRPRVVPLASGLVSCGAVEQGGAASGWRPVDVDCAAGAPASCRGELLGASAAMVDQLEDDGAREKAPGDRGRHHRRVPCWSPWNRWRCRSAYLSSSSRRALMTLSAAPVVPPQRNVLFSEPRPGGVSSRARLAKQPEPTRPRTGLADAWHQDVSFTFVATRASASSPERRDL